MSDLLDDANVRLQRDPEGALDIVRNQYQQLMFEAPIQHPEHDNREIKNIVLTGMGGSALAALLAKGVLARELAVSFDIIRGYDLPAYVSENTLVIASSYSGNTEETLSALAQAQQKGSQVAILASGGQLTQIADEQGIAHVVLPGGAQPRMAMLYNLKALVVLLESFGVIGDSIRRDLEAASDWLKDETAQWAPEVPVEHNYAKQIAHEAVGKIAMFYGGALTAPLAYKWKISWNETAKNLAFWNEFPEFNHNEFMGWTAFPVEKPFVVFDLISSFDHPRIAKRFEISNRLLSGLQPQAKTIELRGETILAQLIWGTILADYASVYAAILNNVDPTPVVLIEKLKQELVA